MLSGQALLDDMRRRSRDENEANRLAAVFLVEATDFEALCLWSEWAEEAHDKDGPLRHRHRRIPWQQISLGYGETVGHFGRMPVAVSVTFARVLGQIIVFYEATSQVVDHRMVDKWLTTAFPASRGKTNATNFHICVHELERARDAATKTETGP